jgi:hypothetical protein
MVTESPAEDLVGDKRVPSLIKELEDTKKYKYDYAASEGSGNPKTTNDLPQGDKSPVGSQQNKIPSPVKGQK